MRRFLCCTVLHSCAHVTPFSHQISSRKVVHTSAQTFTWYRSMVTTEKQITYLTQQLNAMQTDVAELQNALQGSATGYAALMVQLFTSETRVRRVIEAGYEATAVMSRLHALEREAQVRRRVLHRSSEVKKRQITIHRHRVARRAANRSQHSRWSCKLGRITARQHDESHGRRKRNGQETEPNARVIHHRRSATYATLKDLDSKAWKQMVSHFDPRTGADIVCCIRPSNAPGGSEPTDIIKTQDAAECQKHHADVGTRGGRI